MGDPFLITWPLDGQWISACIQLMAKGVHGAREATESSRIRAKRPPFKSMRNVIQSAIPGKARMIVLEGSLEMTWSLDERGISTCIQLMAKDVHGACETIESSHIRAERPPFKSMRNVIQTTMSGKARMIVFEKSLGESRTRLEYDLSGESKHAMNKILERPGCQQWDFMPDTTVVDRPHAIDKRRGNAPNGAYIGQQPGNHLVTIIPRVSGIILGPSKKNPGYETQLYSGMDRLNEPVDNLIAGYSTHSGHFMAKSRYSAAIRYYTCVDRLHSIHERCIAAQLSTGKEAHMRAWLAYLLKGELKIDRRGEHPLFQTNIRAICVFPLYNPGFSPDNVKGRYDNRHHHGKPGMNVVPPNIQDMHKSPDEKLI